MSKWCVMLLGALLALPAFAQQSTSTDKSVEVAKADTSDSYNVAPAKDFFAMPAVPRATPFPGPAAAMQDEAPGRLVPRYEAAFAFEYINVAPGGEFTNFNSFGGTGAFTINANRWLGLNAEVGSVQ